MKRFGFPRNSIARRGALAAVKTIGIDHAMLYARAIRLDVHTPDDRTRAIKVISQGYGVPRWQAQHFVDTFIP